MAHTEDWARRLLQRLPSKSPESMLRNRSYHDATFLPLFFEWLDELIFHDPRAGLRWATVAPELALAAPQDEAHRERVVKAHSILGSANRAAGDLDAADESYKKALELMQLGTGRRLQSDVERRLSYLRACQGRADEALKLASSAVSRLRKVADAPRQLGEALIAQGYVLASELREYGPAIDAFGEALSLAGDARGSKATRRLHASACYNLALAITESASFDNHRRAMLYVNQARELVKGQKRSVARYRLCWVEALLWSQVGSHAKAEKLYRLALEGFEALRMAWDLALVGLDLAALLHLCGRWTELQKLAGDTYRRFRLLAADTQAIAALSLWTDAVLARRWDDEQTEKTRRIVLAGVFSGQCCHLRGARGRTSPERR